MDSTISASISLGDALNILRDKYKKEYANTSNLSIQFITRECSGQSTDWGGFETEYYTYYELLSKITFDKRIGNITFKNEITISERELRNDLNSELTKLYQDDECTVLVYRLPSFSKNEIDLSSKVNIYVEKKNSKGLKRKLS